MILIFLAARRAFDHRAHWVGFPVFINLVKGHAVILFVCHKYSGYFIKTKYFLKFFILGLNW